MTIDEFIEQLEKTPRDWRLDGERLISRGFNGACPICAVATLLGKNPDSFGVSYFRVAPLIDLDGDTANAIAHAADGYGDPDLRARLLRACGLEER